MSYSFLNMFKAILPPWLMRTEGLKVIGGIADVIDDHRDRTVAGVKLRFPGLYTDEGVDKIGRERRLRRGPKESAPVFAARLQRWWLDHSTRGNAYALLEQMFAYLLGANVPPFEVISYNGLRHTIDANQDITRDSITWGTDETGNWSQVWVFIYYPNTVISDAVVEQFAAIVHDWLAAHTIGHLVIILDETRLWDYPQPVPDWNDTWYWETEAVVEDF